MIMDSSNNQLDNVIDQEIDLFEYLIVLMRNKYRVIFISVVMAVIVYISCGFMEEKYESYVHVALVGKEVLGGVSPDNRRAPEVMTMVEHGFITNTIHDNEKDRVLAKMRSQLFTEYFIKKNNLLPFIFKEDWVGEKKIWVEGFSVSMPLAIKIFKEKNVSINVNDETALVAVKITWGDPKEAANLANKFVEDFNGFMRDLAVSDAIKKEQFLTSELKKSKIVEVRKSIYRLMEAQLVLKMLAHSKIDYSLEVLDPAVPPFDRSAPLKKKITLLTLFGCLFVSCAFLIGRVILIKFKTVIENYDKDANNDSKKTAMLDEVSDEFSR